MLLPFHIMFINDLFLLNTLFICTLGSYFSPQHGNITLTDISLSFFTIVVTIFIFTIIISSRRHELCHTNVYYYHFVS